MNAAGGGTNLPGLGGGGGGTDSLTEQAKVKTFGSAFRDFFSGDDGESRRMTDLERSQRMAGGGLVKPITIKPMNINVQKLQGGGRVKNQGGETSPEAEGTDTVPAMLTPGEFVMSRGAVNKWGVNTLESMNAAGGGTNQPKITQKVYARGGGRVPMVYARGGGRVPMIYARGGCLAD